MNNTEKYLWSMKDVIATEANESEENAWYTVLDVSGLLLIKYFTNTCLHVLAFVRIS
ncbi:hypothetical protein [Paenibacillus sp. FSL H7-0918]|uniref:hypothetical protein n=1 Tax=Paenibacillus sp. FSL H7-0918 TaxID=2921442 RepID=UPI0030FB963C